MDESRLTITVAGTGDYIPVSSFVQVVGCTLDILRGLASTISGKGPEVVRWRIEHVSFESPLQMTVFGEALEDPNVGPDVVRAHVDGLNQLDKSAEEMPRHFTTSTLEHAQKLVAVLDDEVAKLTFFTPGSRPATPTQHVAANVAAITRPYEAMTSFEGTLEMINIHGRQPKVNIWDVLTGQKISCEFARDMLEHARNGLGRRVAVYGKARYSREGKAESVQVEEIRPLRERPQLPQARDLKGIDLTGGMESAAYVRRLRDAD